MNPVSLAVLSLGRLPDPITATRQVGQSFAEILQSVASTVEAVATGASTRADAGPDDPSSIYEKMTGRDLRNERSGDLEQVRLHRDRMLDELRRDVSRVLAQAGIGLSNDDEIRLDLDRSRSVTIADHPQREAIGRSLSGHEGVVRRLEAIETSTRFLRATEADSRLAELFERDPRAGIDEFLRQPQGAINR